MTLERRVLRVTGTVQGVGFRPFVYRLALEHALGGWVRNDCTGVTIEATGPPEALERFAASIAADAPPAAIVSSVDVLERAVSTLVAPRFDIVDSLEEPGAVTAVSPDLAVCDDCLRELRDPSDRRYRYPFINCTNCGPRYSIISALPYDRPQTTMRAFAMCAACEREYRDPLDRRFHAQPIACPACGPRVRYLVARSGTTSATLASDDGSWDGAAIADAVATIASGGIVAIKGIGGYHLACDAHDADAVLRLRERKFRKEKPFAVMARDERALRSVAEPSEAAVALLTGQARPIVLVPRVPAGLPEAIAPDNADVGVMLPYAPLHHLLFDAGAPEVLVMTSANHSAEPIAYRDADALDRLRGLADGFLVGERPIHRRVDDSVARARSGRTVLLRRARGYAPAPVVRAECCTGPLLAVGAELKSAIALGIGGAAYVSQHLGDLGDLAAYTAFEETVHDLCAMYHIDPTTVRVAHDRHPAYPSTRFALRLGGPSVAVQHHAAHVASVVAERCAFDTRVLGFAFDGAGLGDDGAVWGGEVFSGSVADGLHRVAHLRPGYLPGGDTAARWPVQAAAGWLTALGDGVWGRATARPVDLPAERLEVARALIERGLNTPRTTSMGRLFDAVAALDGFHRGTSFEGQAAIALEALARSTGPARPYPWPFDGRTWDHAPLLDAVLDDVERRTDRAVIARRFHEAVAEGVLQAALGLRAAHPYDLVVLSGGVFQNALLLDLVTARLDAAGITAWTNELVPANDGGIALGQLVLAAHV